MHALRQSSESDREHRGAGAARADPGACAGQGRYEPGRPWPARRGRRRVRERRTRKARGERPGKLRSGDRQGRCCAEVGRAANSGAISVPRRRQSPPGDIRGEITWSRIAIRLSTATAHKDFDSRKEGLYSAYTPALPCMDTLERGAQSSAWRAASSFMCVLPGLLPSRHRVASPRRRCSPGSDFAITRSRQNPRSLRSDAR